MPNHTAISGVAIEENAVSECCIHPLLAKRRSLRAFAPSPVDPATLATLLEAARWAPSSMNEQPWTFIVATQQNRPGFERLLGCLLEYNFRWAQYAPVLMLSVARLTFASNGAPNAHALYDLGQAVAHLTFQANSLGLTVCQMAGFDVEKTRHTFSIPSDHEPLSVSAIGYPGDPADLPEKLRAKQFTPRVRKPFEDFVFESSWGHSALTMQKG